MQASKITKHLLGLFTLSTVLVIGFMIDTYPELKTLANLKTETLNLKNILLKQHQQTLHYTETATELTEIKLRLNTLIKTIPARDELTDQLIEISKIGVEQGLTFELFKPMPTINRELFTEHPINIKIIGTYAEICLFASGLSSTPRLITLSEINLESIDTKGRVSMTALITSYNEDTSLKNMNAPEPDAIEP